MSQTATTSDSVFLANSLASSEPAPPDADDGEADPLARLGQGRAVRRARATIPAAPRNVRRFVCVMIEAPVG